MDRKELYKEAHANVLDYIYGLANGDNVSPEVIKEEDTVLFIEGHTLNVMTCDMGPDKEIKKLDFRGDV